MKTCKVNKIFAKNYKQLAETIQLEFSTDKGLFEYTTCINGLLAFFSLVSSNYEGSNKMLITQRYYSDNSASSCTFELDNGIVTITVCEKHSRVLVLDLPVFLIMIVRLKTLIEKN